MSNTSRVRGRQRELQYTQHLRDQGWWAQRVDCETDIVAAKAGEPLHFLQVKSTVTPWAHFGPEARAVFLEACRKAGAVGALVWWPKGYGISRAQWFDETQFP